MRPQVQEAPEPPSQRTSVMEQLMGSLNTLLTTGIYSDLTLISSGETYAAHRAVVCLQSPVIFKSCEHQDANRVKSSESSTSTPTNYLTFNFLDDDPLSVDCIVQYFYKLDYNNTHSAPSPNAPDLPSDNPTPNGSDLVLHVKVDALAEKYDIPLLKALSLEKFETEAQQHWRSHYLLDALREAYTSTIEADQGMRTAGMKILFTRRELLDEDNIKELLQQLPQLTYDLLIYLNDMSNPNKHLFPFGI